MVYCREVFVGASEWGVSAEVVRSERNARMRERWAYAKSAFTIMMAIRVEQVREALYQSRRETLLRMAI